MTYTKKQFLEDVKKEARALRKHATPEELVRLDFDTLKPNDIFCCVYGQMTGHCDGVRASELIKNCSPVFINACDGSLENKFETFHYSPIEQYIMEDDAKNKNLIAFLKGERKDLVL